MTDTRDSPSRIYIITVQLPPLTLKKLTRERENTHDYQLRRSYDLHKETQMTYTSKAELLQPMKRRGRGITSLKTQVHIYFSPFSFCISAGESRDTMSNLLFTNLV